ncbi:MAG: hypothetical protein K2H85_01355, partial [Allobaculum sp.]|nr:hypothetical protein [Allobaculum sp.]
NKTLRTSLNIEGSKQDSSILQGRTKILGIYNSNTDLTIDNITLLGKNVGIDLNNSYVTDENGKSKVIDDPRGSRVEITNSKFEGFSIALNINGSILGDSFEPANASMFPTLILDKVDIRAEDYGIYQAGPSTISILNNSFIQGDATAIETRAGNLTVEGGSLQGGETLLARLYTNGSSILGAGLGISQHSTNWPINVTVNGAEISGASALLGVDFITKKTPRDNSKITININDSVLDGDLYDVGYTTQIDELAKDPNKFEFVLSGNTYKHNTFQRLVPGKSLALDPTESDSPVPYKFSLAVNDISLADGPYILQVNPKPQVTVEIGGNSLKEGEDYTVEYKDIERAGEATVIVTLIGEENYKETVTSKTYVL